MDFISLFTSFSGRINRAKWWLGLIIMTVISMAVQYALNPAIFTDPAAGATMTLPQLIANLVIYIPMLAIIFKRLNDRNWPSWVGIVVAIVTVGSVILQYLLLQGATDPIAAMQSVLPVTIVSALVGIFLLIDNGMLKGTVGPNQYGEDPLAHKNAGVA